MSSAVRRPICIAGVQDASGAPIERLGAPA